MKEVPRLWATNKSRKEVPNINRAHLHVRAFPPDLPASAWLNVDEVLRYVPVSRAGWFRGVRSGAFPSPHKVGHLSFWKARDIRVLLDLGPRRARRGKPRSRPQVPSSSTPDAA
jgi:predicted DNA-binding transcriptional regulator AlpA